MREFYKYNIEPGSDIRERLLGWAAGFDRFTYLNSNHENGYHDELSSFDLMVCAGANDVLSYSASGCFDALEKFQNKHKDWMTGYLGYDLKNEIEDLKSENSTFLDFSPIEFVVPEHMIIVLEHEVRIGICGSKEKSDSVLEEILATEINNSELDYALNFEPSISKEVYLQKLEQIKSHIQRGDIYEMNYCHEFTASDVKVDPQLIYTSLNHISPTPFSAIIKNKDRYIISASPERYLKKSGSKLISQPMKGTAERGQDENEDENNKFKLANDPKERSENVMIVDLVRNDLSKVARKNTVKVDELFGIYSFPNWHQMISKVSGELKEGLSFIEVLKSTFPMGSMTGAPKVKAMELIEYFEESKRGVFSGAIGYITPDQDFDFCVAIRTLLYDQESSQLSFTVGGAITAASIPEKEYNESLLKAKAFFDLFKAHSYTEQPA